MLGKIMSVAIIGPRRLEIVWDDGRQAGIDLAPLIESVPVLAALRDDDAFARLRVSADGWSLEWTCGIDFGAAQLRRWADEQAGETMPQADFQAWMEQQSLSEEQAARALGLPSEVVAAYRSGARPIPKTVMLATEGYAARRVA